MRWIESQSIAAIAILVFLFCYMLAGVLFAVAAAMSRWRFGRNLKAATPGILSPLGTIAGLLIAFLAVRVWTNIDHANADMAQQASAISQAVLMTDKLPADMRAAVRGGVRAYVDFINQLDQQAYPERASLRPLPPGLTDAVQSLLSFMPTTPGQHLAQERAVIALEQALSSRRDLIELSEESISPLQWIVIFALDGLILLTLGVIHMDNRPAAVASMLALSTAFAVTLVLLMVYDRPFASGAITLQPLVQEIMVNMK